MPGPRRPPSLERRLPLVLMGVLVTTLSLALVLTNRALVASADASAHRGLTSAIRVLARTMEDGAQQRARSLRAAAASPAIRRLAAAGAPDSVLQAAAASPLRELLAGGEARAAIALVGADGRRIAKWGDDIIDTLPPAWRSVPAPLETARPTDVWFGPLFTHAGYVYTWTAARVAAGVGRPGATLAVLRRAGSQASTIRTLRNLTGEDVDVYFRNGDGSPWIGLPARRAPPAVLDGSTAASPFATRPGVGRVILAQAAVSGTPWGIVLEAPVRSVRATPWRTTRRLAAIFLSLAVAGSIVTWRVARRVTRPLRRLTTAAGDLAQGRPPAPLGLHRRDELGQLASRFDQMAREITASRHELEARIGEAERANRAKSDFLAMMSHELRTPLNAIAGYTQLLEMGIHGPVTPDQVDALRRIGNSERHLLHLIEDVLSFARIDAGRVDYHLAEFDVSDSLATVTSMIAPQARAKRIAIEAECREPGLTVFADREKLDQILLNLLANAVKFTPADGCVRIVAGVAPTRDEHGREQVRIRVSDSGPGVPTDHHDTIFEPFVQGARALNRPSEGVGLGLAISRDLSQGMGGRIALESPPGAGATFVVTLLRRAPVPPPAAVARPELAAADPPQPPFSPTSHA